MTEVSKTSPFSLDADEVYQRWRDWKYANLPDSLDDLLVEVRAPCNLTRTEHTAMQDCLQKNNMVLYAAPSGNIADKSIVHAVAGQFGLGRLNRNWLADDDGLTSLTVNAQGEHPQYIPYTNRPIKWHTDGYYNPADKQIHGLLLYCVHSAAEGGENALMDHEMAYICLREANPDYIRALMQADAMTIPPGTDMHGKPRGASVGPVFSIVPDSGNLHMRYTARKRNIEWKNDALTTEAVAFLENLLESDDPAIFHGRLEAGMGLVSNSVLHDRAGFNDAEGAPARLLYRARYYDRVAGTDTPDMAW